MVEQKEFETPKWLDEDWAGRVRDAARRLVRVYAEALSLVRESRISWSIVRPGGPRKEWPDLYVVRPLFLEAVSYRVRVNTEQAIRLLEVRVFQAQHPKPTKTPRDASKAAALLGEALADFKELHEIVARQPVLGAKAVKGVFSVGRRILPLLYAGIIVTQFARIKGLPDWQLLAFTAIVAAGYHAIAWLCLPFHDAAERAELLFDGFVGTPSDGLKLDSTAAMRFECAFYGRFGLKRPIVLSWDTVVPVVHHALEVALCAYLLLKLPLSPRAAGAGALFAIVLGFIYYTRMLALAELLARRYPQRSVWDFAAALFQAFAWSGVLKPFTEQGGDAATASDGAAKVDA